MDNIKLRGLPIKGNANLLGLNRRPTRVSVNLLGLRRRLRNIFTANFQPYQKWIL